MAAAGSTSPADPGRLAAVLERSCKVGMVVVVVVEVEGENSHRSTSSMLVRHVVFITTRVDHAYWIVD